jgi:hypothetical protein
MFDKLSEDRVVAANEREHVALTRNSQGAIKSKNKFESPCFRDRDAVYGSLSRSLKQGDSISKTR